MFDPLEQDAVSRILARGLACRPDERWPSVAALVDALVQAIDAPEQPRGIDGA